MTLAESRASKDSQITVMAGRVHGILDREKRPLTLDEVEFFIQKCSYDLGIEVVRPDTFLVRDAIARLVRMGICEYNFSNEITLIESD